MKKRDLLAKRKRRRKVRASIIQGDRELAKLGYKHQPRRRLWCRMDAKEMLREENRD